MPIHCKEKELKGRANKITKLLSPILPIGKRVAASRYKRVDNKEYILGAHVSTTGTRGDYRDWRFKTSNEKYSGNYFEHWYYVNEDIWKMKCAYLNLFTNDKNVLSLHCDPDEVQGSAHYQYKRGPHLHLNEIFSSAHVALNLSNLEQVLNSTKSLELALETGIIMIKEQFISD